MLTEKGFINLDEDHQIYYERIGNTVAPTILFFHGGPGLGFSERDKVFFDYEKCNVIFFDQRGSGRSKVKDILNNNTTQDLIKDINRIYELFKLEQTTIFGGSWGSTLALIYAIQHLTRVKSLIMRGLFRGSRADRLFYERGKIKELFPKEWKRIKEVSGVSKDEEVMFSIYEEIVGSANHQSRNKAFELVLYGLSINNQGFKDSLIEEAQVIDYYRKAKTLSHYAINDFFIEDNYIENNKGVLKDIPIHLIHGKQDFICPVDIAYDFARGMDNCDLLITEDGHSPYTTLNKKALEKAIKWHISSL